MKPLIWENKAMRITVLTVPDCPNKPVVQERITAALNGRSASVDLVEVTDQDQATRWGMTGSPTVLLDGVDPFAVPGAAPSVSCRLYRGADGHVEGAPRVEDLRRALDSAKPPVSAETGQALVVDVLDPVSGVHR